MIRDKCMTILLDKIKSDPDLNAASISYDPLILIAIIKKSILAQSEDQYPFTTVHKQECGLYAFNQYKHSNKQ